MALEGILPTYQTRSPSKLPISLNRLWRSKERVLLGFVCFGIVIACFGTVFFLPDLRTGIALPSIDSVYKVVQQVQKVGPELILQVPPLARDDPHDGRNQAHHGQIDRPDIHLLEDQARLRAKIEYDEKMEQNQQKVLPRPVIPQARDTSESTSRDRAAASDSSVSNNSDGKGAGNQQARFPVIRGGISSDPDLQKKRETVRQMMKHAWDNYATYAWGKNELRPISRKGHSASVFGSGNFGATIVDGLDTLYIMGFDEEFKKGRDWVEQNLNLTGAYTELSVFETNIRFIGGLLSCYALTGDLMFRDKALHIAEKLLPAFNTPSGIPHALINVGTGASKNYAWASSSASILAEFGTMSLEFNYLSDVTGNPIFRQKVEKINQVLRQAERSDGLYPNYLNPKTGRWGQQHVSMGALGDSFYEYLLKAWLQSGKSDEDMRSMYVDAMDTVIKKLIQKSNGGLTYFAEMKFGRLEHKMDHLACFGGGLLALGGQHLGEPYKSKHMELGKAITHTCHESYDRTNSKLGPEAFRFTDSIEAKALKGNEKYYILRPEVVESYFVLWRLTHDPRYRQWGWEAVQALEKHCKVDGGYTGIKNVYSDEPTQDDVQQSFFLAETLKYLYLLFSDDDLISLDDWVLNTEAHPLPVKGRNSLYRAEGTM